MYKSVSAFFFTVLGKETIMSEDQEKFRTPKMVVFDLDNCCWDPEMYQMRSGTPFKYHAGDNTCTSSRGEKVRLLGDVADIWGVLAAGRSKQSRSSGSEECYPALGEHFRASVLTSDEVTKSAIQFDFMQFSNCKIGIASCCDEPDWARDLLGKFRLARLPLKNGTSPAEKNLQQEKLIYGEALVDVVDYSQIHYGPKVNHFRELREASGVAFEDMIFFDDQHGHIQKVGALGVTAVHVPSGGVTWAKFEEGLARFQKAVPSSSRKRGRSR